MALMQSSKIKGVKVQAQDIDSEEEIVATKPKELMIAPAKIENEMNLCGECFDSPAVIVMEPCLHAFCDECVSKSCSLCHRSE